MSAYIGPPFVLIFIKVSEKRLDSRTPSRPSYKYTEAQIDVSINYIKLWSDILNASILYSAEYLLGELP